MASRFREAIEVRPRPQRGLLVFGLILAGGASFSVQLARLPVAWVTAGILVILGASGAGLAGHLGLFGDAWVARAVLRPDGRWSIFTGRGGPIEARLLRSWGESLGPVIGLEWACADNKHRRGWLLVGDLSAPVWRRLRVRLRLS